MIEIRLSLLDYVDHTLNCVCVFFFINKIIYIKKTTTINFSLFTLELF